VRCKWDGNDMLFDLNFIALGIAPDECYRMARHKGEVLAPGQEMAVGFAPHYTADRRAG